MTEFFHNLWSMGIAHCGLEDLVMISLGCLFIAVAIRYDCKPLLFVPIGMGVILGNIPHTPLLPLGVSDGPSSFHGEGGSVLGQIAFGVRYGLLPPLMFLGIGAMSDFSILLSNPKLILVGAAAQVGIFATMALALSLGFAPAQAASIGMLGAADGATAIFLTSQVAPDALGTIALTAFIYLALIPFLQPPIMKALTTPAERKIRMQPPREVSRLERMLLPVAAFLVCALLVPGSLPLLGLLFFGNLLKESGVTDRLANTARTSMLDVVTILLGLGVGVSAEATTFLTWNTAKIFALGGAAVVIATAGGVLFVKLMNLFLANKINPLIGAAGVAAVPDSARVANTVAQQEDPHNLLLMHAMAPNTAGLIGAALAAGALWGGLTP